MIGCCNNDHIINSSKDIVYRNIKYQSGTSEIIIKYDNDQLKKMVFTFLSKELFENITKRLLRCNWNTQPIYNFDSLAIEFTVIEQLLNSGADLKNSTPLHYSAQSGHLHAIKFFNPTKSKY